MAVEGGGDYRRRLVRRKQAAKQNKAIRERAFSTPAPPPPRAKAYMGVPGSDKYPWQTNNIMEAAVSAALGLGGVTLGKLIVDPQQSARMAWADQGESDPMLKNPDNPRTRMLMEAAIPGGGVAGPTRRTLGTLLNQAANTAPGKTVKKSVSQSGEYLERAAEEGFISPEFLADMRHTATPLWDRVTRAVEAADLTDVPIVREAADAPKRGRVIIGSGPDAVVREGKELTNIVGKLLGAQSPGIKAGAQGMNPDVMVSNMIESVKRGDMFFGDIPGMWHPMKGRFYESVNQGFLEPLSKSTGLSKDVLAQMGASFSPRKLVNMEMAQTIELAKRGAERGLTQGMDVDALVRGMPEMGLGQLLKEQTGAFLKLVDNPRHLGLDLQNVLKTGVYSLNKARPSQNTISEAVDLPSWTFDTWMRRAAGFSDEALPEGAGYRRVLETVQAAMPEMIPIVERQLIRAGVPKKQAKELAKRPNVIQDMIWHDARNSLWDALGRIM